jgi:hypothetical protein
MNTKITRFRLILLAIGCIGSYAWANPQTARPIKYIPGLGEIMAQTSARHIKLWFAAQNKNWDLAAYELDELHEGLDDAAKFHPTHKQIKQPLPKLLALYMNQPLAALEKAVNEKDLTAFNQQYANLTAACNACHQATEFGFNQITQPQSNPFTNQLF